jgi:hypothetical protein
MTPIPDTQNSSATSTLFQTPRISRPLFQTPRIPLLPSTLFQTPTRYSRHPEFLCYHPRYSRHPHAIPDTQNFPATFTIHAIPDTQNSSATIHAIPDTHTLFQTPRISLPPSMDGRNRYSRHPELSCHDPWMAEMERWVSAYSSGGCPRHPELSCHDPWMAEMERWVSAYSSH